MECIKCVFPVCSKISQRIRSNRRGVPRRVKEVGALICPVTPSSAEIQNESNYTPRTSVLLGQELSFEGSFAQSRKSPITLVMSVHLSVSVRLFCMYQRGSPLDAFPSNFILKTSIEIWRENKNMVKIG